MRQIATVAVIGPGQLLLDVHVDVERRAVHRRGCLHPGRVRLHVRRPDGGRRTHADRRVGVRERRVDAHRGRDGSDGGVRVDGRLHVGRERLGPRILPVDNGTDGVVRSGHHGNFDGHFFRSVACRKCVSGNFNLHLAK